MGSRSEFDMRTERDISDAKRWMLNSGKSRVVRPQSDSMAQHRAVERDAPPASPPAESVIIHDFVNRLLVTKGIGLSTAEKEKLCDMCRCTNQGWWYSLTVFVIGVLIGFLGTRYVRLSSEPDDTDDEEDAT